MPMKRHGSVWSRPPPTSGERRSDITQPGPWPKVKRGLIAILRGLHPDEAEVIVETLIETGFELIEVPLNSPDPFVSIERLCKRFGRD
jgi:2-dehydro-3-deoxyphosphogalactonate aldolase